MTRFGSAPARSKPDGSLITDADLAASRTIRSVLQTSGVLGDCRLLDEETAPTDCASHTILVIDPLDGTTNFAAGVPFFAVSIALVVGEKTRAGVVFNPNSGRIYHACHGRGAFVRPAAGARTSDDRRLDRAPGPTAGIFGFCHGEGALPSATALAIAANFKRNNPRLRQFGSAALELCMVAEGKLDGFFMNSIELWDVAAGALIAAEAGCGVCDFAGRPFSRSCTDLVASRPEEIDELLGIIRGATASGR